MEILLNELSLEGQYISIEDFVSTALTPMLKVLKEIDSLKQLLLKSDDIFNNFITKEINFGELISKPLSIHRDEMRKLKRSIDKLSTEPFWNNTMKQTDSSYIWNEENIWGTSLAEAAERDKTVVSFLNSRFEDKNFEIIKDSDPIRITNITEKGDLPETLWQQDKIDFGQFVTSKFIDGKLNFSSFIDMNNFMSIDKKEQSLFLDTFRKFEELEWNQILKDQGLNYKPFHDSIPGYSGTHPLKKFRASRLIRCHGYRDSDTFFVLMLEVDHSLSDKG